MTPVLLLLALSWMAAQTQTPVDLTSIMLPPDSKVDVPLIPSGQVELRGEPTLTRLRVRVDRTDVLTAFGPAFPSFVVWAVSPEGEVRNLGALEIDGRRAELETTTAWDRLGVFVTAEPHHLVDAPSAMVALKSGPPDSDRFRSETIRVEVGRYDYSELSPPSQGTPPRLAEARLAFAIAGGSGAADLAPAELRAARVALDSMEELAARELSPELLLPYVNDAVRQSDRAARLARVRAAENELTEAERRVDRLASDLDGTRRELEAAERRLEEVENRRDEILLQLQQATEEGRAHRLENDDLSRRLRDAEARISGLEDPWPPVRTGLARLGARETARGMVLTLPGEDFEDDGTLGPSAYPLLDRLLGALAPGELPDVRIEGHTAQGADPAQAVAESTAMAEAVRDYLVDGGIPPDRVRTTGMGDARPLAGTADPEALLNRRVEILFTARGR